VGLYRDGTWGQKGGTMGYTGPCTVNDWLEVEGPLHAMWPPLSHRLLFGALPITEFKAEEQKGIRPPVRTPLKKSIGRNQPDPEPGLWTELPERLELAAMELAGVAPDDQAAAARWDWRRQGALQWTALRLLAPEATSAGSETAGSLRQFAQHLAVGLGRLDACTSPLQQARQGRLGLPLEALEARGIPLHELPEALGTTAHSQGLAALVLEQLALGENALALATEQWQDLKPTVRSQLRHTAVRLALARDALQRLQQQPLNPRTEALLPPWRTLWSAWYAARRADR
jgi:hypothetical protein